jgi:hypothetical protein
MSTSAGFDPFWMRHALGRPETCTEGVDKRGVFDTCDKVAVALRLDPEEQEPYPVCARHARADMVPLEAIVRFMLNREQTQQMIARGLAAMADKH